MGEEINRLNALDPQPALPGQQGQIPGQGGRVAADVGDGRGRCGPNRGAEQGRQALAGGIEQQAIDGPQALHQAGPHLGLLEAGPVEAIGGGIGPGLLDRGQVAL